MVRFSAVWTRIDRDRIDRERRMRLTGKRKVDIREKVLMLYGFLVQLFLRLK